MGHPAADEPRQELHIVDEVEQPAREKQQWRLYGEPCHSHFNILPRGIRSVSFGIHHGVSHQHLQAYLNEFTFRFNRRFYPFNAFRSLLGIAGDTSAPTYAELYSGEWRHPTCSGHGR